MIAKTEKSFTVRTGSVEQLPRTKGRLRGANGFTILGKEQYSVENLYYDRLELETARYFFEQREY